MYGEGLCRLCQRPRSLFVCSPLLAAPGVRGQRCRPTNVDEGVHAFILCTADYQAFSDAHAGRFLYHNPRLGGGGRTVEAVMGTARAMKCEGFMVFDDRWAVDGADVAGVTLIVAVRTGVPEAAGVPIHRLTAWPVTDTGHALSPRSSSLDRPGDVAYPDDAPRPVQGQAVAEGAHRPVSVRGVFGVLIEEMLRPDPADRPTSTEVCEGRG